MVYEYIKAILNPFSFIIIFIIKEKLFRIAKLDTIKDNKDKKNYRPNVAAIVLAQNYPKDSKVLIALRKDIKNAWQFPQGGIDDNETSKQALYRELKEEIGTNDITIIAKYPNTISYDFPKKIANKMYPFDGQEQTYYLVQLNKNAIININTHTPEFSDFKFIDINNIDKYITSLKKNVYKKVLKYFKEEDFI
jgi:putative (di)nucleoside polyphosphate hydrolase